MAKPIITTFCAGETGQWAVDRIDPVVGEGLALSSHLLVEDGRGSAFPGSRWTLTGTTSNTRYTARHEVDTLASKQAGLCRAEAVCAALIPIRKNDDWWALAQDERRAIMEEQSRHITIGMGYLPAIARRLYHSRELGQPFDFLTWFEFAPEHASAFEEMVARLRETEEWRYVDREVDIRLVRTDWQAKSRGTLGPKFALPRSRF